VVACRLTAAIRHDTAATRHSFTGEQGRFITRDDPVSWTSEGPVNFSTSQNPPGEQTAGRLLCRRHAHPCEVCLHNT